MDLFQVNPHLVWVLPWEPDLGCFGQCNRGVVDKCWRWPTGSLESQGKLSAGPDLGLLLCLPPSLDGWSDNSCTDWQQQSLGLWLESAVIIGRDSGDIEGPKCGTSALSHTQTGCAWPELSLVVYRLPICCINQESESFEVWPFHFPFFGSGLNSENIVTKQLQFVETMAKNKFHMSVLNIPKGPVPDIL